LKALRQLSNPKTAKELVYIRAYHDFQFFVDTFFPHHCEFAFSKMHQDFCDAEQVPARRGRREVVAAPRGNAKTTFKVLFKVIHAIVYGYEPFIVIMGHSAPEAEKKVEDILNELENNRNLIEVYGCLAPVRGQFQGMARWGNKKFVAQNGCLVMAKSRGKQVRGIKHGVHRPSLVICDDIEAPDKVLTEEQRLKTRHWFEKDILKMGRIDGGSNIIVIGTCLHPESLLSQLLEAPGWQADKYQAVESFAENQPLWQQWREKYTNLSDPHREVSARQFLETNRQAMLKGTKVLWPAGEPYERLMTMMVVEGIASFQSEKQNDPYDPERQLFDMSLAKKVHLEFDRAGHLQQIRWQDGSDKMVSVHHIARIIAFHDPALANTKESDFAAIVVAAEDRDGFIYCLDAYIEKVPPSRQIEQAYWMQQKWGFEKLYLETNNFQGVLKHNYRDMQDQQPDQLLRVIGVNQHHNKVKRISSLEPLITNGQLLFADSLTPRLMTQLSLFPTSYDDGPDALHGAVERLKIKPGSITQVF